MLKHLASRIIPIVISVVFIPNAIKAESTVIERIQESAKSIVSVRTELTRLMPTTPPRTATFSRTGAGLVLDAAGIIVTNTHTILNAPFIFVILRDGTKLPAKVIFASSAYDFSFLRINPPYPLQAIQWADSSQVNPGDTIIAVGNTDYDNQSIMSGHIINILQSHTNSTHDFFEIDLDLYHGDSGGPILDEEGRLLGMIMAKRKSEENSSLAIAADKIHAQYLQYKENMT